MTWWQWLLVSLGVALAVYGGAVLLLVLLGRREDARATATLIPDCAALLARLVRDPRVPRRRKLLLVALAVYLASPIDLIPDFIPIAEALDDAILVALSFGCSSGPAAKSWSESCGRGPSGHSA